MLCGFYRARPGWNPAVLHDYAPMGAPYTSEQNG